MAEAWERDKLWETSRQVGELLVQNLAREPGQTILENAAGTGETGFAAAVNPDEHERLIIGFIWRIGD